MNRLLSIALLIIVLSPSLLAVGCAASPTHDLKLAAMNMLPTQMQQAPTRVREAYQFAVANPDALKNVPCYCGCGAMGHTSNLSCYIKDRTGSDITFDQHALGCSLCVDISQDVMQMTRQGRTPPEIRAAIVSTYSKFGPPNQ